MSPLIETIRIEDGKVFNLPYHTLRMRKALHELTGNPPSSSLDFLLENSTIPAHGLFKVRVIYTDKETELEIAPYTVRPVSTIRLVYDDQIAYKYKYADRRALNALFANRGNCDDVLIIKNGLVTDTSYANIVFRRNHKWVTPQPCLLPGTQRHFLLDQNLILEEKIGVEELGDFSGFKLINSMMLFAGEELPIENIHQ